MVVYYGWPLEVLFRLLSLWLDEMYFTFKSEDLAKYFYFKYEKFYLLWILSLGTKAKCISGTLNRVIS